MNDQPEIKERQYPLLAIILPFVGLLMGALLENGTDGLCKLGIVNCRTPETEVSQLRQTVVGLQENLGSALNVANSCQGALTNTITQLQTLNFSIPPVVQTGSTNPLTQGKLFSLEPYKSRIDDVAQELLTQQQNIIGLKDGIK